MTTFETIELARLEEHPKNPRKDLGDLAELAMSIQAKGIEQALTVVPKPGHRTKYLVLGGHRRRAAAKLAKLRMVPCMIRDDLTTEAAQIEFMLVENVHRRDLTVLEEAEAVQGLFDLGLDEATIAENIGRSRELVRGRAKIARLGDKAKAKLEDRTLTIEQALVLTEFEGDEAIIARLIEVAGDHWNWKHAVENHRTAREVQAKIPKTVAALRKAGAELLESRPDWEEMRDQRLVSTGDWNARKHFEDWTVEQHIAAGHKAVVDRQSGGNVNWIAPRPTEWDEAEKETPEQAAAKEAEDRIVAGLEVAAHVRDEFVREAVLSPPATLKAWAKGRDVDELMKILVEDPNPFALAVLGIESGSDSRKVLREKLCGLPDEALAVLRHIARFGRQEKQLRGEVSYGSRLDGWGTGIYSGDYSKKWRETLENVLGYVWSDIEKEALEYVAKRAAQDADEDENWCVDCGEEIDGCVCSETDAEAEIEGDES
ncbi:ParB/RepB/Spo0J family partition protein [Sinomonas sp. JGH33]|uniref:ParB/RepB/Spo0J family partition protein n=1 Tax=Sinomonas terricola TaxID=3110330 RepID=A0ABU5T4A5_9MICC|nr:ParB/RepB/Spo0J family partition protein [Sinomonas sp. JGH33]MEA5454492.1 ParB/RepB/Spo0J family partition protein [Sinomonas sp. JGH33]